MFDMHGEIMKNFMFDIWQHTFIHIYKYTLRVKYVML